MAKPTPEQVKAFVDELKKPVDELALPVSWPLFKMPDLTNPTESFKMLRSTLREGGARKGEFFMLASGPNKTDPEHRLHFLKQRLNSTEPNVQSVDDKAGIAPEGHEFIAWDTEARWTPAESKQAQGRVLRQGRNVVLLPCIELPVGKSRNVREGRYAFKVKGRHTRKKTPHQVKQLQMQAEVYEKLQNKAQHLNKMLYGKRKENHES